MLRAGSGISWQPIILVVIVAILGLYLFSKFTVDEGESIGFQIPEEGKLDEITLMAFKILIIGAVVMLGITIAGKVGKPLSRRDAFTLILIGIAVYFLWENVLRNVLEAPNINEIVFGAGEKLGLFK